MTPESMVARALSSMRWRGRIAQRGVCVETKKRKSKSPRRRYIIQLDHPGIPLAMTEVKQLAPPRVIDWDTSYGPLLINPRLGRYVVRGTSELTVEELRAKFPRLQFFADAVVQST
jgi:hypothetical protein